MLKEPPVQIGDIVRWSYNAYNLRFVGFIAEIDVYCEQCRIHNFEDGSSQWHCFDRYGNTMIKAEDAILSDDGCHYVADVRFTDG